MQVNVGDFNMSVFNDQISLKNWQTGQEIVDSTAQIFQARWVHVLLKYQEGNASIFVNGEFRGWGINSSAPLSSLNFISGIQNILLDEVMVYNRALTDSEIGHLAGNVFLDLSGNKYNAVARGT